MGVGEICVMTSIAPSTRARARQMRSAMTAGERRLWRELRDLNRRLGFNFRRKAPVGHAILDFAEFGRRLVIEIAGSDADRDGNRADQAWLQGEGFTVLHFRSDEVDGNPDLVMQRVLDVLDIGGMPPGRDA